jgi:hypothetical protein
VGPIPAHPVVGNQSRHDPLLALWDSDVTAHRDRSGYLDDAHRRHVVDRVGNATDVALHAVRIAGVMDLDR